MKEEVYDTKSIAMWTGSTLMNIFGSIDRSDVSFCLGLLSTAVVIIYHIVKIRKEIRNK